jgi:hypothetical protein
MSDNPAHGGDVERVVVTVAEQTPLKGVAAVWKSLPEKWKPWVVRAVVLLAIYPVVSLAAALTIIGALPRGGAKDFVQRYVLQAVGVDAAMNNDLDQSNKAIDASLPISFEGGNADQPYYFRLARGQTVKFWIRLQQVRTGETGQVCDTVNTSGGVAAPLHLTAQFGTLIVRSPSSSQLARDIALSSDKDGAVLDVVTSDDWAKVTGDDATFPVIINIDRSEPKADPSQPDDPFYKCWSYKVLVDMDVFKPKRAAGPPPKAAPTAAVAAGAANG